MASQPTAAARLPMLDLATAGMKNTKTTGAIDAGSNRLRVASTAGFAVGDRIAVAVGGEAGRGRRATMGVGGGWPKLSGPSIAAIRAMPPPAGNINAYVSTPGPDYGKALKSNGTGTAWYEWDSGDAYRARLLPRALIATVTAIDGSTLVLDKSAAVAASKALVVFDNASIWEAACTPIQDGSSPIAYKSVRLPFLRGLYFARPLNISYNRWAGIAVYGGGIDVTELRSVPGTECAIFSAFEVFDGMELSGFDYVGNFGGVNGCMSGLTFGDERIANPTDLQSSQTPYFSPSVLATICGHLNWFDYRTTDIFLGAISLRYCHDCVITPQPSPRRRFTHVQNYPLPGYVQWWYQTANGRDNTIQNAWVNNICAMASFEPFQEEGTLFIDCGGKNALTSFNSTGACAYIRPRMRFTTNDAMSSDAICRNAVMQNNTNADTSQNQPLGCTLTGGSPGTVNLTSGAQFREVGDVLVFTTTGALPDGLIAGQPYYVSRITATDERGRAAALQVSLNRPARDGSGGVPVAFGPAQTGEHRYQMVLSRLSALGNLIIDPYIDIPEACNAKTGASRTLINLGPTPTSVVPADPKKPKGYLRNAPYTPGQDHHGFMAVRGGGPGQKVQGVLAYGDLSAASWATVISTDSNAPGALEVTDCGFDFAPPSGPQFNGHDNLSTAAWIKAHGKPA